MKANTIVFVLAAVVLAYFLFKYGHSGYGAIRARVTRRPGQKKPKVGTATKGNDSGGVLTSASVGGS
jgi:hypothetical protein